MAGKEELFFHYQKVEDHIMEMIENGALQPGEKVPSLRSLSARMRLSITTVSKGYVELERRGVIESRQRSGFFVRPDVRRMPPTTSAPSPNIEPRSVNRSALIRTVVETGLDKRFVQLGCALTDDALLPVNALGRIMGKILRDDPRGAIAYETIAGNAELRRQIAFRSIDAGAEVSPDRIIITNGCMEALYIALRAVTRTGDTVLVQSPTFHCMLELMEGLGLRAVEVPSHPEHGIRIPDVENAIRKFNVRACLLTLNFNNPDGSLLSETAKADLVDLLSRHDVPMIEDDVYGDCYFGDHRPAGAMKYDERGLVISCSSFSKTLAPGYRIGWIVPGRFYEKATAIKTTTNLCNASPTQMAVAEYLKAGQYDRLLKRLRAAFERQTATMRHNVVRCFPEGTKITRPRGGSFLWVELPKHIDATELFYEARSRGVSVAPGAVFSTQDRYGHFIRLSCGNLWSEEIAGGIELLGKILAKMR